MNFGLGCLVSAGSDYHPPLCDCEKACSEAHFDTKDDEDACYDACPASDCLADCATAEEAEIEAANGEKAAGTCTAPVYSDGDDCYDACDATYDSCKAACPQGFPGDECRAACEGPFLICRDPCFDGILLGESDCEGEYEEAIAEARAGRLNCEKPCCSASAAHPVTCESDKLIAMAVAMRAAVAAWRSCYRVCQPMFNAGDNQDSYTECENECYRVRLASEGDAVREYKKASAKCINDEMRSTKQCGWLYRACRTGCEEDFQEGYDTCDRARVTCVYGCPRYDGECEADCEETFTACKKELVTPRYDCRFACCVARHGTDPFEECYAACARENECTDLEGGEHEDCVNARADCEDDCLVEHRRASKWVGSCSKCGVSADLAEPL